MGISVQRGSRAFQTLKQACMNSPVLAFANYTKDFLLETDVSKEELGAVLSQKQEDGQFHPVAYGSWALTTHEKNYHSTKLEFLALKWAVTEHFKEYLLYQPFLVKTDNNPLTYIGSQALTIHEKNYHSTKLEFLVLKWAVTEHFKEYLLYHPSW